MAYFTKAYQRYKGALRPGSVIPCAVYKDFPFYAYPDSAFPVVHGFTRQQLGMATTKIEAIRVIKKYHEATGIADHYEAALVLHDMFGPCWVPVSYPPRGTRP